MYLHHNISSIVRSLATVTNAAILNAFTQRLADSRALTRDEGVSDHFCCMFIPYAGQSQSVFVGRHIKSGLWMPPGGHIDTGETPGQTVMREIQEELCFTPTTQPAPYALTFVDIENRTGCTRHYDIWYLMECEKEIEFNYEKREFHEAGWCTINEALLKSSRSMFTNVLKRLQIEVATNVALK